LIESELFGHERGSFTGAERLHKGYFERATPGTLFLDEITEMPIELQVKLLRVLETGALMRIGGERPLEVNVRVIAATNRKPEDAVAQGKLREDLLYRLSVFPIQLPALRERGDDVGLLADHFGAELNQAESTSKGFNRPARQRLRTYAWPGNVRELKNSMQRAALLSQGDRIGVADLGLPASVVGTPSVATGDFAEPDREAIEAALRKAGGVVAQAAGELGLSRQALYRRMERLGIERPA
jgi:DNA-binding NtrC family response regulator